MAYLKTEERMDLSRLLTLYSLHRTLKVRILEPPIGSSGICIHGGVRLLGVRSFLHFAVVINIVNGHFRRQAGQGGGVQCKEGQALADRQGRGSVHMYSVV